VADDKHAGRAFFAGIADCPAGFLMFHVLFPQFKINLRFVRRRELCFGAGFGILVRGFYCAQPCAARYFCFIGGFSL
jgi:hypothetical protein